MQIIIMVCCLAACKKNKMQDLHTFAKSTEKSMGSKKAVIQKPDLKPVITFSKNNVQRDPFESGRQKETGNLSPLQKYPLTALKLVGIMANGNVYWAVFSLPDGQVLDVSVGGVVGQNNGKISRITQDEVTIIETNKNELGGRAVREITLKINQ